ncbi:unnamed protein product, partial [Rotaria socialis]
KQTFIDPKAVATTGTTTTATIRREKYEMVWEIHALSSFITSKPEKKPETSQWAPSRGPMGASLPRDVCNMDESPLSLFGDQSRLSINDVNTSNDIEGCISNKRFATVILTIFGSDNTRFGPVLIFKGKGQASSIEKMQYANGVKVYFTPKAVSNRITMDK